MSAQHHQTPRHPRASPGQPLDYGFPGFDESTPPPPRQFVPARAWWRRARVLAPLAFVLGLLIGGVGATAAAQPDVPPRAAAPAPSATETLQALAEPLEDAGEPLEPLPDTLVRDEAALSELVEAEEMDVVEPVETTRPKPKPKKTPKATPRTTTRRTVDAVSYENCTEAREAGAAPVHRGDPGYGSHLDRDDDGVGCES